MRNKAFFFGNLDWGRKDNPSGVSVSGSGQQFGRDAEIQRFLNILQTRYNYNPGGTDEFIRDTKNDKVFVRTDFNLRPGQQLTVRHNYVNALNDIGFPGFISMMIFLAILTVGFIYEWMKGALEWE